MKTTLIIPVLATGFLVGCKNDPAPEAGVALASPFADLFLADAPQGAIGVAEAFADPTPGKSVTVSGEVMGRLEPFVENRAMLVLGDPEHLTPCNRKPGDECPTPWDVCCDDPDVIKKSVATIQIVDDNGMPLKKGLRGANGIIELSALVVTGTIAEGSNENNLLINATGIHVRPSNSDKDHKSPARDTAPNSPSSS